MVDMLHFNLALIHSILWSFRLFIGSTHYTYQRTLCDAHGVMITEF
jgi:hypothetical protein